MLGMPSAQGKDNRAIQTNQQDLSDAAANTAAIKKALAGGE
jgi:hypothetical protein